MQAVPGKQLIKPFGKMAWMPILVVHLEVWTYRLTTLINDLLMLLIVIIYCLDAYYY